MRTKLERYLTFELWEELERRGLYVSLHNPETTKEADGQ